LSHAEKKPQAKFSSLSDLETLLTQDERTSLARTVKTGHDGKGKAVRVLLDTQGRKGKAVTVVAGLQHNPATMEEIARILKQHCGAGGTVKNGQIEIQGDQRERVSEKLRSMNYVVR